MPAASREVRRGAAVACEAEGGEGGSSAMGGGIDGTGREWASWPFMPAEKGPKMEGALLSPAWRMRGNANWGGTPHGQGAGGQGGESASDFGLARKRGKKGARARP